MSKATQYHKADHVIFLVDPKDGDILSFLNVTQRDEDGNIITKKEFKKRLNRTIELVGDGAQLIVRKAKSK